MSVDEEQLRVLKATYDRLCKERDRLRALGVSSQDHSDRRLPRPASRRRLSRHLDRSLTPVSYGRPSRLWLFLSSSASPITASRHTGICTRGSSLACDKYVARQRVVRELPYPLSLVTDDGPAQAAWYQTMIKRERAVRGDLAFENNYHWPWFHVSTLQEGLDVERTGLRAVQALWLAVIVLLVVAVLG